MNLAYRAVNHPVFFVVGISHKTAPLATQESIYIHESESPALIDVLKSTLDECLVLSTCNRTEVYGVARRDALDLDLYKDLLIEFKAASTAAGRKYFYALVDEAAFRHLFRVASSVDSKIVGDTQILGQLRLAYDLAKRLDATGKITNQLFQRAFKIGKKARSETNLHKGAMSVGLAAVELAAKTGGSLTDKTVLIIGAGETARLTGKYLTNKGVGKIIIANRTRSRAEEMLAGLKKSRGFTGEVRDFVDLKNQLNDADIVISATSSQEPILSKNDFASQTRNILLIDIAMPRNIAPEASECEKVTLKNLGDLHTLVDQNYRRRMAELPRVNQIIQAELVDFHNRSSQVGNLSIRRNSQRVLYGL